MICGVLFNEKIIDDVYKKFIKLNLNGQIYQPKLFEDKLFIKVDNESDKMVNVKDRKIILGEIYTSYAQTKLSLENIAQLTLDKLIKNYWGNYIFIEKSNNEVKFFVAPFSRLQIFYILNKEYLVFASDIVFLSNFIKLKINNNYMQYFLLNGDFLSNVSPFIDINVLYGGQSLSLVNGNSKIKQEWQYQNYCENTEIDSSIAEIFYNVITSKTKNFNEVFLELSGGTDSTSIMLALNKAKRSGQKIYAFNISDKYVKSSNELEYVIKLNKDIDFELIRIDYSDCMPFSDDISSDLLPNLPSIVFSHIRKEQLLSQIAYSNSKSPLFINGHGGDSAFLCPPPMDSLADLLLDKRFSIFKEKLKQLAVLYRSSYGELLTNLIKVIYIHMIKKVKLDLYHEAPPWYIEKKEINNVLNAREVMSWPNPSKYPGKLKHIHLLNITFASTLANLKSSYFNNFFPFLTQPIVELALKIKTYDSFSKGYDRFLFRNEISEFFSSDTVWRKNKGETTGVFQRSLRENKEQFLETCLNGYVAKQGLIDKDILKEYFMRMSSGFPDHQWAFIHLMCYEKFVQYWRDYL